MLGLSLIPFLTKSEAASVLGLATVKNKFDWLSFFKRFFSCIFFIIRLHHSSPISFDTFFFFISHFTVRIPLNNVTYITGYVLCRRIDPYTIRCLIYEL